MSNKPSKAKTKTNITKITASSNSNSGDSKAKPTPKKPELEVQTTKTHLKKSPISKKSVNTTATSNPTATEKAPKKPFILFRPFVALGRYLRDSWREIRQVRWPSRKATWKMVLAVFFYCAIFMIFILILDAFFTFIFNQLLNIK